jgi:hypothetical protein
MTFSRKSDRWWIAVLAGALVSMAMAGCAPKIVPKRSLTPPPVAYCHDAVGHISGNKPWILGGNCCCTPTKERFAGYQQEGTVPGIMTYEEFLQLFKDKGIITDLDIEYRGCNCRDAQYGPHVVFGGHCMVTPTPGTKVFEDVTAGKRIDTK